MESQLSFLTKLPFNLGRFETKRGAKICANPEEKWVKRAVTELQKKKRLRAP